MCNNIINCGTWHIDECKMNDSHLYVSPVYVLKLVSSSWRWETRMLMVSGLLIFPRRRLFTVGLPQSNEPCSSAESTGRGSTGRSSNAFTTCRNSIRYRSPRNLKKQYANVVQIIIQPVTSICAVSPLVGGAAHWICRLPSHDLMWEESA